MTLTGLKAWRRIRKMDWDELRTRNQQAIRKRFDHALSSTGFFAPMRDWKPVFADRGKFFFSADKVPALCDLIRKHLPQRASEILQEADAICHHRFRLLGYANVSYGTEVEWHIDPIHRKRAPLKAWYKIPFLDFSVVGDHKITWELNRHQHLVTLAKAWVLTGDEKYTTEIVSQWYSWRNTNPYLKGINWASSLEVSFRSLSWLWVSALVAGCRAISQQFWRDFSFALARHGTFIENNLSTYFSPNTHLLGEGVALFFIGTLCPDLTKSKRWQNRGWRIVEEHAERQIHKDGTYFERSLYYHVYALDFLLHARVLAARNGIATPSNFDATLKNMVEVVRVLGQAGPPQGFGDDDGGRVFDGARNRSEHLVDPLSIAAVLYNCPDLSSIAPLTEESIWLFGEDAISGLIKRNTPEQSSTCFENAGIYLTSSPKNGTEQMIVHAGPTNRSRDGHGHADRLSITLSWQGRNWLIDPGTLSYVSPQDERARFRGTAAHNTLTVDGQDQSVPDGLFAWVATPTFNLHKWVVGNSFTLFCGSHDGYKRLPNPVRHRRLVFHFAGNFWLIHDLITGAGKHHLEAAWHFAPDLMVNEKNHFCVLAVPKDAGDSQSRMAIIGVTPSAWKWELGSTEVSPAYGLKQTSRALRVTANTQLPAECGVLIKPISNPLDKPGALSRDSGFEEQENTQAFVYRYTEKEDVHHLLFSNSAARWQVADWSSDAFFIHCCSRAGRLTHFNLCDGTFAKFQGSTIFRNPSRISRFEWLKKIDGESRVHTPSQGAEPQFYSEVVPFLGKALSTV